MTETDDLTFVSFPKIGRLRRDCLVTEKIDGTNAQIAISDDGLRMKVGSRNRWITPEDDNHGFAKWAHHNHDELMQLGPGRHFGEWWGTGIQRRYEIGEKRFSLFNVSQWVGEQPACCDVVPVLYKGLFSTDAIDETLERLRIEGSVASPGFMQPEGIIVMHLPTRALFKRTIDDDEEPKSLRAVA